ncbi:MAG: hypothetical protein K6G45_10640 [Lachnospiraceae bacterium]|nr:hypothetical protein [Lachnospiraceae bacterium]
MSMGIMGIGLISFCTVSRTASLTPTAGTETVVETPGSNIDRSTAVTEKHDDPTPTPTLTPTPEPNYLLKNSDPKVKDLVNAYLAAKLSCTQEAFEGIVTDTSFINIETLMIQTETVLSYDLLDCYTKKGYSPIDYVVYYTYNMNIATLSSPVLAIDSLYVKVDDNGDYKVFLGRLDDDVENKLEILAQDEDVQDVLKETKDSISKAMDEDETLLQYWQRLYEKLGIKFDSETKTVVE